MEDSDIQENKCILSNMIGHQYLLVRSNKLQRW